MATTESTTDTLVVEEDQFVLREYEVRGAGCSYFVYENIPGPGGKPLKDLKGDPLVVNNRHFANKGDKVKLDDYQAAPLLRDEIIQPVGSAPIPGIHANAPLMATPFGVPVQGDGDQAPVTWVGPVMGNPAPAGPGTPDHELTHGTAGGSLTPEQQAEYAAAQRTLLGENDPEKDPELTQDEQDSYDSYKELDKSDLETDVKDRDLKVKRRDGREDLPPRVEDLAFALAKDDYADDDDDTGAEE